MSAPAEGGTAEGATGTAVADGAAAAAHFAAPAQQEGGTSPWGPVLRMVLMYMAVTHFMGRRGTSSPPPSATPDPLGAAAVAGAVGEGTVLAAKGAAKSDGVVAAQWSGNALNAWPPRALFDLRVYVNEGAEFTDFRRGASSLVWEESGLGYGREDAMQSTRSRNVSVTPSKRVLRNETALWMHVFLSRAGTSPDPAAPGHRALDTVSAHHPLVKIVRRKKPKATRNLLSGQEDDAAALAAAELDASSPEVEWIPHWKPALTISIVEDFTAYPPGGVPPQIKPSLKVDAASGRYWPVIFCNEFWLMSERLVALNETVDWELPLELSFSVTTLMRWMLTEQMSQSMAQQAGMHGEDTVEEMRRMFAETSPWLLGLTATVSCLHTIFDILAFKNDISFWKNNKSMKGLSFRAMLLNLFFQTVIFLYLADNDTSWMILFSSGMGLAIEVWKLRKAIKTIELRTHPGNRLPSIVITPTDSYTMSETRLYDEEAMRYLSTGMYPLVAGYAIYSLAYDVHKSWYSWLLGSTVNFVYSFGFVLMTPQLFINYKLKSTAHMPWKTFMYKALNTFIDDLFAFIIKMPTMHRLSCLRDDFIFLIYLYQRWTYGVDTKRANEYGQVGANPDETANADVVAAVPAAEQQ